MHIKNIFNMHIKNIKNRQFNDQINIQLYYYYYYLVRVYGQYLQTSLQVNFVQILQSNLFFSYSWKHVLFLQIGTYNSSTLQKFGKIFWILSKLILEGNLEIFFIQVKFVLQSTNVGRIIKCISASKYQEKIKIWGLLTSRFFLLSFKYYIIREVK